MEFAYPDITEEQRQHLALKGLRAYKPRPIPDFLNPHTNLYWGTNILIMMGCWYGRKRATASGGPRVFWSAAIVGFPFFGLISKGKLDAQDNILGKRKDLEERLEYSPIARRAWNRAMEINQEYQNNLRSEIFDLEAKLYQKNKSEQ